jgi:signal transduction histidine kinase
VNGLLGRIEAAQDDVLPLHENLPAMHAEAMRLSRLLDDLARLADAERPGLLLEKQPLDLAEVARAAGEAFAPRFAAAAIDFAESGEPVTVEGDAGRIEEIIANLLSNALRYSEPGGRVSLATGRVDSDAFVEVTDTGSGIAPEDLPHIFTRFWRGDRSRSRASGGTGIGLAIVHELVRAHDGRIEVESTLGLGTRMRVLIPAVGAARIALEANSFGQVASDCPHGGLATPRMPRRGSGARFTMTAEGLHYAFTRHDQGGIRPTERS